MSFVIGYLTQAENIPLKIKVEWKDIALKREQFNSLTLTYTFDEIKEEVAKRSSYLGKYRNTEEAKHLLDAIAMTEDESDLFTSFLETAAADVYDAFSKYTGNDESAFTCDEQEDKVEYVMLYPKRMNQITEPLHMAVKDALVYGVLYNWLLVAYPDEAEKYIALYSNAMEKVRERANTKKRATSIIIPRPY